MIDEMREWIKKLTPKEDNNGNKVQQLKYTLFHVSGGPNYSVHATRT